MGPIWGLIWGRIWDPKTERSTGLSATNAGHNGAVMPGVA